FEKLPFSDKTDLRKAYPLGLQAVPDEDIIRIHSSSGSTGTPVIIPYTRQDVADWSEMMERCFRLAGLTKLDRVQITPGYGLWTAGIGFQTGVERLGAMAVPMGPGNTEKQLQMMQDLKSTVLISTSSYALLIAEEIEKRGIKDKIHLKRGIIGSERWGDKMRARIESSLGIEMFDIYGLTEIYGPGISIDCHQHSGMHYFDDYLYFEVIDPDTLKPLPAGETGELVITTLAKQGAPLLRYRTHDITRLIPGECPCGCKFPRHDRIVGRTDDMVKVKGVLIYPAQVDKLLASIDGASSEYQIIIDHKDGKDVLTLNVEIDDVDNSMNMAAKIADEFKAKIGIKVVCIPCAVGQLPRNTGKTKRVFDNRVG
ncbi:MAG TPA: phenylacetate--CoA ligase, partial [Ruminococcaceae bacterium]|nr:phenylacetate--CoA ligase [Oscillospiraceae bacterium]